MAQHEVRIVRSQVLLVRLETACRMASRSLLLLAAIGAVSCWRLTPVFAQLSGEPPDSIDDADSSRAGLAQPCGCTNGPSWDAGDHLDDVDLQAPKADAQPTSGSPANQSSTAGTPNPPSGATERNALSVNPVTGIVSASESNYEPLTGRERVRLYFRMNYASVGAYFGPFFTALVLDQATGTPAKWGGGFAGYGRRVASRLGSAILQGTFQAPVAALLHEDVRYIASSEHGFKRRAWHAVKYSFLTYNSHGQPTVNVANLSSYYVATAITTTWLPGHYNAASYTLSNATEQVGLSVPLNLLQEFWPEIRHSVLRRQ